MQYIIGSWYRREELAKRSCIFHTSGAIASMFSGYLMAGVYRLDGKGGLRGWQWLFVVDGIISLPIAALGFFALPDLPEISKPFYLTEKEVAFAQKRMQLEGRQKRQPYTKAKIRKIFSSWHIYALVLLYVFFNNGTSGKFSNSVIDNWSFLIINRWSTRVPAILEGEQEPEVHSQPDKYIPHDHECGSSCHHFDVRLDERQYSERL
jgi:hypothetical protein